MTAYTQSGYPVLTSYGDPAIASNPTVPGSNSKILGGLRKGDPAAVMLYSFARFHAEVENLGLAGALDDWGFTPKQITGGTGWSNHAGAVAGDLNSTRHPQHKRGTFSSAQFAKIREIARDLADVAGGPVLRLGIDWSDKSVDEMHQELYPDIAGTGRVEKAARAILHGDLPHVPAALGKPSGTGGGSPTGGGSAPSSSGKVPAWPLAAGLYYGPGSLMKGATLKRWQTQWNRHAGKAADLTLDGVYGPATQRAAMTLQRSKGMKVDGLIGRATWTSMFGMG